MAAKGSALTEFAWALQILAAAQFFVTGLDKLGDAPPMIQLFQTVGFGQWFRYFTGALEVVSSILLLMPSLSALGAAFLGLTMIGALIAHATILPFSPAKALILFAMVCTVFWVRRKELTV